MMLMVCRWGLVLVWMGLMFWLSSIPDLKVVPLLKQVASWLGMVWPVSTGSGHGRLEFFLRKSAHVTEYAILTWLWLSAAVNTWHWSRQRHILIAMLFAFGFAVTDEIHQELTGFRDGRIMDVGIDGIGIIIGIIIASGWGIFARKRDC